MRAVAGILIVLVTIVVYLQIRAGQRRERQIAEEAEASAKEAKHAGGANHRA